MEQFPRFAVVGHPNKGKSSIVATLARDESVVIGERPGTTQRSQTFPMRLGSETLYELVDTPGFQRPREVLEWLRAREQGTASRPGILRTFLELDENRKRFPDEVEILEPIVAGAAILYVVDGSVPFSEEYEVELEILRWSGAPRLGLVNPIANERYVEEWKTALGQYCSAVRVFNPVLADFSRCIELLSVCASLHESWAQSIKRAIAALEKDRQWALEGCATQGADLIVSCLGLRLQEPIQSNEDVEVQLQALEARYFQLIRETEQRTRASVESLYHYTRLHRVDDRLKKLEQEDVFSGTAWRLFGLTRWEIAKLSALAGAAAGGVFDVISGGSSLALGALGGSVIGAGSALLFAEKFVERSIGILPLGKRLLSIGPMRSTQLGFVLLNRFRLHHKLVSQRSHADRRELSLEEVLEDALPEISQETKKQFDVIFRKILSDKADSSVRDALSKQVLARLLEDRPS